ncbi:MAG TPA: ABC transporter permease [Candidatus Krumholzibacteria bacterium]|nr:ABC transporter permease [Candidatus Krumholzibacteria bacterium]
MNSGVRPVAIEWLSEFYHYRELFYFLVWRDVKIRYKQTLLGASWAIIQPFSMMVVFSLLFGRMAKMDSEGVPYPVFSYAAMVPWTYFQYSFPLAGNSLISNSRLISKVYFPRAIIPAASALSGAVDFFIAAVILLGVMLYYHVPISASLLLWPVLLLPLILFTTALGMFFASLNVKFRDIKYTIPFLVQVMMFISPVIYPASKLPAKYQMILRLNPMVGIIDAFRAAALPTRTIDWASLGIAIVVTLVLFAASSVYFYKTEREFADII